VRGRELRVRVRVRGMAAILRYMMLHRIAGGWGSRGGKRMGGEREGEGSHQREAVAGRQKRQGDG
jgi:hypothetical protein